MTNQLLVPIGSIYSLANGNKFLYLSDSYFLSDEKPAGEKRWYDSFTTHAISFSFIANKFQDDFSKNTIRKLIKYKFDMSWKAVIVERAKGYHTGFASHSPKAKKMLISFWMYPNCYVALVLFAVPRKILSYMYCLYRCTMR